MRHGLGLFLMTTILVASLTIARSETIIIGRATVIDGDTIEIQGERIRLNGVDAPKSSQLCRDGGQRRGHLSTQRIGSGLATLQQRRVRRRTGSRQTRKPWPLEGQIYASMGVAG